MNKLIAFVIAAAFATAPLAPVAFAADAKKPTKEECAKKPDTKGCEEMKKDKK